MEFTQEHIPAVPEKRLAIRAQYMLSGQIIGFLQKKCHDFCPQKRIYINSS